MTSLNVTQGQEYRPQSYFMELLLFIKAFVWFLFDNKRRITQMQAFELFCEGEFHQAMEKYSESKVDPIKVIALYPDLVPKDIQIAALKSTRQPGKSQIHTLFLWRPVNAIFHFCRCQKIFCAFSAFAYKFNAKLLPDFNSL